MKPANILVKITYALIGEHKTTEICYQCLSRKFFGENINYFQKAHEIIKQKENPLLPFEIVCVEEKQLEII